MTYVRAREDSASNDEAVRNKAIKFLRERSILVDKQFECSNNVHLITGRSDQSLNDLKMLYPDHPAVKKLLEAEKAVRDHEATY